MKSSFHKLSAGLAMVLGLVAVLHYPVMAREATNVKTESAGDGAIRVPAFDLPVSHFLGSESREALRQQATLFKAYSCPSINKAENVTAKTIGDIRKCIALLAAPVIAKQKMLYDVEIKPKIIAGIYTEIITPAKEIPQENRHRVLINLHGGGHVVGARAGGQVESIPIAALGKIKVISIDYRMGPEHQFPAASEDVAAVYKVLLENYRAENIGIYGCSAGGRLTGEAIAWFLKEQIPLPGAIGIFCSAPTAGAFKGDSAYMVSALFGVDYTNTRVFEAYFGKDADFKDPLISPIESQEIMARFPPTLLISATRDFSLSQIVHTHSQLVKLGVEADLHIWEGLGHGFFGNPDLPESREAYDVIVKFFDRRLGAAQ